MYSAYSAKLSDFIAEEPNSLIGQLQLEIAKEGFGQQWNSQTFAWQEEIEILQRACKLLIQSVSEAQSWLIFLEYEIARRGRRIDAVLLMKSAVAVLEFKVGLDRGDSTLAGVRIRAGSSRLPQRECDGRHPVYPEQVQSHAYPRSEVLVIWLPTSSGLDATRDCKGMDSTAEFLLKCGLQSL